MEIVPKLNLNRNYKDVPNNSVIAAKNMVVDDTGSYYTNEWGFKVGFECPNKGEYICGVVPTNKEFVIFTYCSKDKVSRIYRKTNDETYEVNVGWTYSGGKIVGSYTYNYKGELIIAIGEYDAVDSNGNDIQIPYKSWNLDSDSNSTHNQEAEIGKLNTSYSITQGNLVCGVYTFFIRYAINDVDYTKWFQVTPEIIIIQSKQKEAPTHNYLVNDDAVKLDTSASNFEHLLINDNNLSDKGIVINIANDNNNFTKYQLGYIIKRNEEVLGRIQNEYTTDNEHIIVADNIYTQEESVDEFLKSPNQLYNVKNVINYNNRIYLANYDEYKNINIQSSNISVATYNKDYKDTEASTSYTNIIGQISYNGVSSGTDHASFTISVDNSSDGTYNITDYKSFIINNLVKVLRLYNDVGEAVSPYSDVDVALTESGKAVYRSAKQSFQVVLFNRNGSTYTYSHIYSSSNKTVSNIHKVYIKDNKIHLVLDVTTGTTSELNKDIILDDWYWNVRIITTAYLTHEEAAKSDTPSTAYNTPVVYYAFIGEPNAGNRVYPVNGWKPTTTISTNKVTNTFAVNNGIINKTLVPYQSYNVYVHFIRKDGSYTNGYEVYKFNPNHNTSKPIIGIQVSATEIPNGYIGYFLSYEDVEDNVINVTKLFNETSCMKLTTAGFIYNGESIYGDTINDDAITSKEYNKSILTTSNVAIAPIKNDSNLWIKSSNTGKYYKKTKTLYRLTENYYDTNTHQSDAYLPAFYNREKIIVFADKSNPSEATKLKEVILNAAANKVVDSTGAETDYGLFVKADYVYSPKPLDAYSIKQDYSKGAVSLVTSTGGTKGVFYNAVLSPDKLHDFLEIKGCYTAKPSKSFTNYNEDYTDKFNKTIRRSNVISDESLVNGFRIFDDEQYKIIKENKGDITNIVGIGLYLLVHTQYSLFVFDRSPKLTNSSQLQIPDTFDIDYQEVLPSNEGFGGLADKEECIVSKNGYIWYDSVNKIIFKYENGKASVLSSDINNFIKDVNVSTVRFGEDLITNRIIICIYVDVDNSTYPITISYNFNTNTFISLHDYSFTNCYRTYDTALFLDKTKDRNRLYQFDEAETTYKNLRNDTSLYYPKYIDEDAEDTSHAKPYGGSSDNDIDLLQVPIRTHYVGISFKCKEVLLNYKYIRLILECYDGNLIELGKTYPLPGIEHFTTGHNDTSVDSIKDSINNYVYWRTSKFDLSIKRIYGWLYDSKDDYDNDENGHAIKAITDNKVNTTDYDSELIVTHDHTEITTVFKDVLSVKTNYNITSSVDIITYMDDKQEEIYQMIPGDTATYYRQNYTISWCNGSTLRDAEAHTITIAHKYYKGFVYPDIERKDNNIVITNHINSDSKATYTIRLYRDDDLLETKVFSNVTNNQVLTIENSISNKISFDVESTEFDKVTSEASIKDNIGNITVVDLHNGTIRLTVNNNSITKVYYNINGDVTTFDKEYVVADADNIKLNNKDVINAAIIIPYNTDKKIIKSVTYTYYYSDNSVDNYDYVTKDLSDELIKNYVDVIHVATGTENLDSINYILNEFKGKFNIMNPAEQMLNRRFSGDSIILYSDETYTGAIDINDEGNTNYLDNYKLPTFQKGHWEFNYFRNDVSRVIENGKYIAVYYDTTTNSYKTKEITDNEIKQWFKDNASDNQSLVYGKYIVARFIFNNDKRVKLEGVSFITNNY